MSSIDTIGITYFDPAVSRALVPVQPSNSVQNNEQQPLPQQQPLISPTLTQRVSLEARADLLQRPIFSESGASNRTLHALKAYKSLSDDKERDQISRLLGVDEFA